VATLLNPKEVMYDAAMGTWLERTDRT